jgi:hypothetical protein
MKKIIGAAIDSCVQNTRHDHLLKFAEEDIIHTLTGRINQKYPYPILRHHFSGTTMQDAIEGIRELALSKVLDVISVGPDLNAQEHFFKPNEMTFSHSSAGGIPIRKREDMKELYDASQCGNFPLMHCYTGTQDLLKWSEMSVHTLHNAWGVIPLCWNSVLNGISNRTLEEAIDENQRVMKWYARHNIPVEVNESQHWSLYDAHDALTVAMDYLAAYNAKKMGVKEYVVQFIFNTPTNTKPKMDLAKMEAKLELIHELEDESFKVFREIQIGIFNFPSLHSVSKLKHAPSFLIGLAMKPHILHVVSYTEGGRIPSPLEVIENCKDIHKILKNYHSEDLEMTSDMNILIRKGQLVYEARMLLEGFKFLGADTDDPLIDPWVIANAIHEGILDVPDFKGNPDLRGDIHTELINGARDAIDPSTGDLLEEETRLLKIFDRIKQS